MSKKISDSAIRRLSFYHRVLEELDDAGALTVSSGDLAERSGTTAAQIRKDLSLFGSFGKRGLGYSVPELVERLREILGLDRSWRVALVGAGRIGAALFEYAGFRERGFRFVAVLDADPEKVGSRWADIEIHHTDELERVVRDEKVDIVVLAVPREAVEAVMAQIDESGVRAVLNFAPMRLDVPEDVTVRDVNMVMELEALSYALTHPETNGK